MLSPWVNDLKAIKETMAKINKVADELDATFIEFFKKKCKNLDTLEQYQNVFDTLPLLPYDQYHAIGRHLCRTDLFFLLTFGLNRHDAMHPWILERCKEVQNNPDGYLDLWARDHYKSTIISFALPIQDILSSHGNNPDEKWMGIEVTNCILSHTRPIAKGFLRQIKREFEANELLRNLFPDIIWANPDKEAPKWSEDDGIILKRKSNPKESTLEAWGLVEGQPTSKHFNILTYDDVVTQNSVNTPDMIKKTVRAWEMSVNLGTKNTHRRAIGTIYNFNDAYMQFIKKGTLHVRKYPGTEDGTFEGRPVLKTREQLNELLKLMGPDTFSSQILLDPRGDGVGSFNAEDMRYHDSASADGLNVYMLIDPANEKTKGSDYTVIKVVGLGDDGNYHVKDIVRDRLNLTERAEKVFELHRKWRPLKVGYEKVGMQADIQHIKYVQGHKNYFFDITPLHQTIGKTKRIEQLQPLFADHRVYFPRRCLKTNYEGVTEDLTQVFIEEEFRAFPVAVHDDILDALSMILHPDMKAVFPNAKKLDIKKFMNRGGVLV